MKLIEHGFKEGEKCERPVEGVGCTGVIAVAEVENCRCHINPPCSACTTPHEFCPECGWEAKDDAVMSEGLIHILPGATFVERKPRVLDRTKIDYTISMHSSSSQKVTGVFPPGTTQEEVRACVNGTFGGRFERWDVTGGNFTFIAYTD